MKKIFIAIMLLFSIQLIAQNSTNYQVDYYNAGNAFSDSLQFAVGDSATAAYYANDVVIHIAVDSNWTASNIGFLIYNYLEAQWEPFYKDGSILEYEVAPNEPVALVPAEVVGLKYFKLYKVTSGSPVAQATNASNVQLGTVKVN